MVCSSIMLFSWRCSGQLFLANGMASIVNDFLKELKRFHNSLLGINRVSYTSRRRKILILYHKITNNKIALLQGTNNAPMISHRYVVPHSGRLSKHGKSCFSRKLKERKEQISRPGKQTPDLVTSTTFGPATEAMIIN